MGTKNLPLAPRLDADGYYRISWVGDVDGNRHVKAFGRNKKALERSYSEFRAAWATKPWIRNPDAVQYLTVQQIYERFATHATAYYVRADGSVTGEPGEFKAAMGVLLELAGTLPAQDVGANLLRRVQEAMVAKGWCARVINKRVSRVRHVFKWAASYELVDAEVWHRLLSLGPVKAGRDGVPIKGPVRPAPEEHVWAVVEKLPKTLAAMVKLQWFTGMRPGEVCSLRPIDLDTKGEVWIYRPARHKTQHLGRERVVMIGPQGQGVLEAFLSRKTTKPCFSAIEAVRQRHAKCATHRHQDNAQPATRRRVGPGYDATAYARAIRRVCVENGIPAWSPNQLRHNFATRVRGEFGLDAAQVLLGHATADVTQIYADADAEKARALVRRIG